jgi:hypothetical protein
MLGAVPILLAFFLTSDYCCYSLKYLKTQRLEPQSVVCLNIVQSVFLHENCIREKTIDRVMNRLSTNTVNSLHKSRLWVTSYCDKG